MSNRASDNHDLTVFPTGPAVPEPPAQASASGLSALEAGITVHEFRILKLIGEGGFGIVYLAEDQSLDRTVALKEYMPSELAERAGGTSSVQVRSQRYAETFEAGMRSFINEARLLARFDHPSLLKVYRFFQANGTAYMAMPFYEGQTLKAILREKTEPPEERWLRHILYQLLDALEIIHRHECYHRDIAPDNVLMLQNDTPILLDFGAARRVIGDMTQNLTVILKPGYAPIEQYAEDPDMKQGPWTDIYALASVVHFALTRKPPPASIARAMNDGMEPLAQRLRGAYSEGFLSTIDKALSLKPQDRPQSIAALRAMLLASVDGTADEALPATPFMGSEALAPSIDRTGGRAAPSTHPRPASGPRGAAPAADEAPAAAVRPKFSAAEPRNRLGIVGLAVAVPAALGFLWWLTSGSGEPPPVASPEASVPPESASVLPPARVEPPPPAVTRPEPPPRVATPAPTPMTPPPAAAVAPKPVPAPVKIAEAPPPKPQPQASALPPAVAATKAPEPPPQQLARVEPKPEPAPPPAVAKSEPPKAAPPAKSEAPKPPVEVARVEPPAQRPAAQAVEKALIGRYTGKMEMGGWPVVVTLEISAVQDGTVTATANQSAGPCAGSYRLTGTVRDDALRMRSTHAGGRGGDCSFGFRGSVQGAKLVGTTGNNVPLEFAR